MACTASSQRPSAHNPLIPALSYASKAARMHAWRTTSGKLKFTGHGASLIKWALGNLV